MGCVGKSTHVSSYLGLSGTWMPKDGSKPYDGTLNKWRYGEEYKVEMRCPFEKVNKVVEIIRELHPLGFVGENYFISRKHHKLRA